MSFGDGHLHPRQPLIDDIRGWHSMLDYETDEQHVLKLIPGALIDLRSEYDAAAGARGETGTAADFLHYCLKLSEMKPTEKDMKRAPFLDPWCAVREHDRCILLGVVTGHSKLREGARIYTSLMFQVHPDLGWARTWSRFYRLGAYSKCVLWELQYEGKISGAYEILSLDQPDEGA